MPDSRAAMGLIASAFYDHAAEKLKIIGITGTNGKTTTSYMLASVLRRAGKTVAVVGTLGIYYGQKADRARTDHARSALFAQDGLRIW